MNFDKRIFRDALGLFVTGVTVITTLDGEEQPIGITANSFNSVSLDPPLVLWSVGNQSRSIDAFQKSDWFAVHILRDDQMVMSQRFASRRSDKFLGIDLDVGLGGVPLLKSCAARLETKIYGRYPAGDHMICIAEVKRIELDRDSRPLVYHGGTYAELADVLTDN
ncbi:MAG: flavin reductase family protein [Pseudomonadota bacterium]